MNKNSIKAINRVAKKYRKSSEFRAKFYFTLASNSKEPIDANLVLLQSFGGDRFGGAPFYILMAMEDDSRLASLKKVIAVKESEIERTEQFLFKKQISSYKVVAMHTKEYCETLAKAKYLVNNSTFPTYFIKDKGQKYLNTWHGTPLKTMGRKIADKPWGTGNTQRNFLMADYLLYPNRYTFEHFVDDYMIRQYFTGRYLLGPYPANDIFFVSSYRETMRQKLDLNNKKVVAYMPTWRPRSKGGHRTKHLKMVEFTLMNLDEYLDDNTVVYAQSHYYDSEDFNFDQFKKVLPFPSELETYELLALADILITDYSSVMFDFLNLNKEIILYDYDFEEYFLERGTYLDINELPFKRVEDSYSLCKVINEIDLSNNEIKYESEIKEYCTYDNGLGSKMACNVLFFENEEGYCSIDGNTLHNDKKNILIYAGGLAKNGITSALEGLLENLDIDSANYLLTFKSSKVHHAKDFFDKLSNDIDYLPMQGTIPMTYAEALSRFGYYRQNNSSTAIQNDIDKIFCREAERCFPNIKFNSVVHFTGYERDVVHVLLGCSAENRVIFIHSDMVQEREMRNNFHQLSISQAYKEFDKIVVVREGLVDIMSQGFDIPKNKFKVVHNTNKIHEIKDKSSMPVSFDQDTYCNIDLEYLKSILGNDSITKYITIGRFSPEKGHLRLISAFKCFSQNSSDSYLIIIGGQGPLFEETLEAAGDARDSRIIIIKSISNPYTILNKCDAFIMSSFYEGLPMTILESLILGKPVICTSIQGPREFLKGGYGYLVPDSEDGLLQGFQDFHEGKISDLKTFDPIAFNEQALEEFYDVVNLK